MNVSRRKGATSPLCAIMLVMLVMVLGSMVETNWLRYSQFETQSAADLGSKSAMYAVFNSEAALDQTAINSAKEFGAEVFNLNTNSRDCSPNDLKFGNVKREKFSEISGSNFRKIEACKIDVELPFNPVLGKLMATKQVDLNPHAIVEASKIDLVISIDASRSMNYSADRGSKYPPGGTSINEPPLPGSRWFALTDAINLFFGEIKAGDIRMGLTTFGGGSSRKPRVESPLDKKLARTNFSLGDFETRSIQTNKRMNRYAKFPALGYGTSIYDGLNQSIDILNTSSRPSKRIVLLFTDGNQSPFLHRPSELEAADRAARDDITVYTVGYSVNGSNLQTIADMTGGKYFAVSNPRELQQAFEDIAKLCSIRLTQ